MPTNSTTETHLSKDELMEILNEIDTEHQYDRKVKHDNRNNKTSHHRHPNPSNQFY